MMKAVLPPAGTAGPHGMMMKMRGVTHPAAVAAHTVMKTMTKVTALHRVVDGDGLTVTKMTKTTVHTVQHHAVDTVDAMPKRMMTRATVVDGGRVVVPVGRMKATDTVAGSVTGKGMRKRRGVVGIIRIMAKAVGLATLKGIPAHRAGDGITRTMGQVDGMGTPRGTPAHRDADGTTQTMVKAAGLATQKAMHRQHVAVGSMDIAASSAVHEAIVMTRIVSILAIATTTKP